MESRTGFTEERGGGCGECFARALSGSDGLAMLPLPFLTLPPALDLLSGGITAPPGAAPGTGDLLCRWLRSGGIGGIHDIIHDQVCMSLKQSFPERHVYQLV